MKWAPCGPRMAFSLPPADPRRRVSMWQPSRLATLSSLRRLDFTCRDRDLILQFQGRGHESSTLWIDRSTKACWHALGNRPEALCAEPSGKTGVGRRRFGSPRPTSMGVHGQPGTARRGRVTGGGQTLAPAAVHAYRAACARLARWRAWNRPGASGAEVNDSDALRPARRRPG